MKHLNTILTVLTIATAGLGCSNHNRTGEDLLTPADVQTMLQDAEGAGAANAGGGNIQEALSYKDDPDALVYVAFGPTPKTTVANVVSFLDFSFLGAANTQDLGFTSITDARVIFIDSPGKGNALIIGIKMGGDAFSYYAFTGSGAISGGKFEATLSGGSSIRLESFDIKDGDFANVIQLKLYDSAGNYIGKVPTLTGFSI